MEPSPVLLRSITGLLYQPWMMVMTVKESVELIIGLGNQSNSRKSVPVHFVYHKYHDIPWARIQATMVGSLWLPELWHSH
jgi:hypothetical protein